MFTDERSKEAVKESEEQLSLFDLVAVKQTNPSTSFYSDVFTRDSIYAKRVYAMAILSVRLSHGWISQKRLKLGSRNFHHTVAPSL